MSTSASDTRTPHSNLLVGPKGPITKQLSHKDYSVRDQVVSNLRAHLYVQLLLACLTFPQEEIVNTKFAIFLEWGFVKISSSSHPLHLHHR
jgi:hypothetical protein